MKAFSLKLLSAVLGVALLGCDQRASAPPPKTAAAAPVAVTTVRPSRGEVARQVTLPATVVPNLQATLFAKVTGYLQKISVDKGDSVNQGDLIAMIQAPELIADQSKFKADLDVAEIDYKRTTDAQQKAPDLIVLQSVDTAKAKFLAAKANLARAETLLGFSKITAPFAGVITKRFADPGAFIPAATASSSPQTAAIVTLVDFSTVRVQIAVPEAEAPRIKNGLPVRITVDELAGRTFAGTITRYAPTLDETKTMMAEVELQNPKSELLPGMYVTARIAIQRHENALLLPVDALSMEKANAFVFVATGQKAKKTAIKVGFNDGTNFEIASGLNGDESVIRIGKTALTDGQAITVTEAR
jgi:membrane fusion protein (multidrug efflux system)